ncbi:MAG: hypothetical protein J6O04_00475 [Selenomonadaceae bacterium]|nr:hypothetical protein [Selenomonadaceae bacterium]
MAIFDDGFDFDKYVRKRLMEMDNLESRELFKEIIRDMMGEFYNHVASEYKFLEDRVFKEAPRPVRMPDITTGVVALDEYDVTDRNFRPMDEGDLEKKTPDTEVMLQSLADNKPYLLYTAFIPEDYFKLQNIENRVFHGLIELGETKVAADFKVKLCRRYMDKIEGLYDVAKLNNLPWRTVLAPYLYKFFDVMITRVDEIDTKAKITNVTVDFEEYNKKAKFGVFPIWNLFKTEIMASAYPQPVVERAVFEHVLYAGQFKKNASYLLTESDSTVRDIRWQDGDLYILADGETPGNWGFYEVHNEKEWFYHLPAFDNRQYDTFSNNMREYFGERIKSKTEIIRYLSSFVASQHFNYMDVKLMPAGDDTGDTYDTESFINYEYRWEDSTKTLMVYFDAQKMNYYLNRDILSFLITNLSHFFPEYNCVGKIV